MNITNVQLHILYGGYLMINEINLIVFFLIFSIKTHIMGIFTTDAFNG